jgi:exo-beta-1,3-glucanase (GH17 family)
MGKAVSLFTVAAAAIVSVWWWLGQPIGMPLSPLQPGEKLYCVSYAPFHGNQTPLDLSTKIEPSQIERDLEQLSKITDCVRTYSVDFGLDRVPDIARRFGLKVFLGLWVSNHAERTKLQIDTGIALARRFPDVIRGVIVGNEVLLRGETSPEALAGLIRQVRTAVPSMPVTYADVWEFWLRHKQLVPEVSFVTIHILPYWEDHPIRVEEAANHIASIREMVARELADKEIMIGEVGWPSAGRMREGALPSRANQAFAIHDLFARAKRDGFRVNLIEAFDQPWKRFFEGTVGGHWGIFDDATRQPKFSYGAPISNHPLWPWQAAGGVVFAALVFGSALFGARGAKKEPALGVWIAVAINAAVGGALLGLTIEHLPVESLGVAGWTRTLAFAFVSIAAPLAAAAALTSRVATPGFAQSIGAKEDRAQGWLPLMLGLLLVALFVLSTLTALGFTFDPRYRDFPFAPLTAAAAAFLLLTFGVPRLKGANWPLAETVGAAVLIGCGGFIVWNETPANWQALWTAGALAGVAITLLRSRTGPATPAPAAPNSK